MAPSATESLTLPVLGMSCASCQHHVETALRETEGVESARVDLMAHRASVVFDPALVTPMQRVGAIRAAGYDAVLPRPGASTENPTNALEAGAERKAFAALIAGAAAMLLGMPLGASQKMGALDHALMRLLPWLFALPAEPLRWFLLVLTAVIGVWVGRGIYLSAARGLRHGTTNMNTLVSLGTGVAFFYSAYATIWPAAGRAVYFDAVLLILGFLLLRQAAAEERSNHPLAHAIVDEAKQRGLSWPPAAEVQILPGRGLTAKVEGHDCLLGNEALFQNFFIPLPAGIAPSEPGVTRLWMALDRVVAGCYDARDALRPDAAAAVAALQRAGLRVLMLTGDSAAAAAPIARQAGITEIESSLDPAGKLARIRALQQSGLRVAMVGDGINDAAALAQADAGIAMGSGADLAQEAGDVLLLRAQPAAIPAALDLARSTLRVMRQNLAWAAAYNLLGIPLAAGALYPHFHLLLSPGLAAAAMALSSVSVLAISLRLRGWAPAVRQTLAMRSPN